MADYCYSGSRHFSRMAEAVEEDTTISPEEKERRAKLFNELATLPREKWQLKHFLLAEEDSLKFLRPKDGEELSEQAQNISDYMPKYFFAPHTYNPDYYHFKKKYIQGPFRMPNPLAFHLTVERLIENEDVCSTLLDKGGEELLTDAAKMVIGGYKSFHSALYWLCREMEFLRASLRKSYMTTATYIGCPLVPLEWAIRQAEEMKARGEMPEKLYTGYEPSIEDAFRAMETQKWNEALDSFICIENGGVRPDGVPKNYLELNQWTDPQKVEKYSLPSSTLLYFEYSVQYPEYDRYYYYYANDRCAMRNAFRDLELSEKKQESETAGETPQ